MDMRGEDNYKKKSQWKENRKRKTIVRKAGFRITKFLSLLSKTLEKPNAKYPKLYTENELYLWLLPLLISLVHD